MTKHLLLATTALALVMGPYPQVTNTTGTARTTPERTVNFHFNVGAAMAQEAGGAAEAVECDPATQDCPSQPPASAEEAPAAPAQEGAAGNAAPANTSPTAEELERRAAEEAAAAARKAAEDAAIAERRAAEEAAANERKAAEDAAAAERKAAEEAAEAARRAAEDAAAAARAADESATQREVPPEEEVDEPAVDQDGAETPVNPEMSETPIPESAPEQAAEPTPEQAPETPSESPAETPPETPAEQPVDGEEPAEGEEATGTDEQPVQDGGTETGEAATTDEAPKPEALTDVTVEEQIEKASEEPVAVVPEGITEEQRRQLRRADERRREDARERRNELIGAAAVGLAVGALLPSLGGRVVEDQGDRFVVERDGRYYVRRDESALFRYNAENVVIEPLRNGRTREIVTRPNGSRIITVRDAGGYILRRVKVTPDGDRYVLFDARDDEPLYRRGFEEDLPPLRINMPREQYIVVGSDYSRRSLADIFAAPPVQELPERYSLREVRESEQLRSFVRRVDLDTINFASGSAYVTQTQVDDLANIAGGMLDVIESNPGALFLVEGHTDAVGSDISNLTLSDRRAETVARILAEAYDVPAENMVVEGYGEQFLKVDTQGDERANRRVTVRNISPLLETAQN